jgi:esterase/lipase superfamily enzyme
MKLEPGSEFGRYQIAERLGAGEVFRAMDLDVGHDVAIRTFSGSGWPESAEDLAQELLRASALEHPVLTSILATGEFEGTPYLVMEFLEGETLEERLKRGPLSASELTELARGIVSALVYAHSHNIVHRDLKPGNILLTSSGVKLLDLGLSRLKESGATAQRTATGAVLGTMRYMSPEQVMGQRVNERSDVYGLGAVLYEAATGEPLVEEEGGAAIATAILRGQPKLNFDPSVPLAIRTMIQCSVQKDPAARWDSRQLELLLEPGAGQAITTKPSRKDPFPSSPAGYRTVTIYYATDRELVREEAGQCIYGTGRAADEKLSYGICDVSVPHEHKIGKLEKTPWFRSPDPAKDVLVIYSQREPEDGFFERLEVRVKEFGSDDLFVFVHGFNVTFEDAARRTAQIAKDLEFPGAPILYSWPSHESPGPIGYATDGQTIDWTKPHLKQFLYDLKNRTKASKLHLIAHSMGSRAVVRVLNEVAKEMQHSLPQFQQIILSAPDIDTGEFQQLASAMRSTGERVTLYASSVDKAMWLSRKNQTFPRAGEAGDDLVVLRPEVDTIDATAVDTGFLGHSYWAEVRSVVTDIFGLVRNGLDPDHRATLEARQHPKGPYWAFKS